MRLFPLKSPLFKQFHINVKCKRAINGSWHTYAFKQEMKVSSIFEKCNILRSKANYKLVFGSNLEKKINLVTFFRQAFGFFGQFPKKNRVRQKNNTVFGLEKTVLDRIPCYRRTGLKEECLYLLSKAYIQTQSSHLYFWVNSLHAYLFIYCTPVHIL